MSNITAGIQLPFSQAKRIFRKSNRFYVKCMRIFAQYSRGGNRYSTVTDQLVSAISGNDTPSFREAFPLTFVHCSLLMVRFSREEAVGSRLKGEALVRDALARALFDAPPQVLDYLGKTWMEPGLRPCDAERELARRVVAELDHAGWVMWDSRDCAASSSPYQKRLRFEDHVAFGIKWMPIMRRKLLGDRDARSAGEGRAEAAAKIVETLQLMKVRLRHIPRRVEDGPLGPIATYPPKSHNKY